MDEFKKCEACGEPVIGRSDKRFCDDSCRNAHNYSKNRTTSNYVRKVQAILKRNRRILEHLNPEGKTKKHRDHLAENGYNFNYHTNTSSTRKGTRYVFCFEQGYAELENGWLLLVRRDEYLERSA